jgi:hypothetical protein
MSTHRTAPELLPTVMQSNALRSLAPNGAAAVCHGGRNAVLGDAPALRERGRNAASMDVTISTIMSPCLRKHTQ